MEIKYFGHSSFFVRTKDAKVVMDPFDPKAVGIKFPKTEADIVTVSHDHPDHNCASDVSGSPVVFSWPGQFERNGVRVWGYKTFHDKKGGAERGESVMYKLEADGVSLLHSGDLGAVPDDAFIDEIGETDVLLVPVGGTYTIDADEAMNFIKKVEPSIVIPMHYAVPGGKIENLAPVMDFLKKIGAEQAVPQDKLVVKPEELDEEMKIVVLNF